MSSPQPKQVLATIDSLIGAKDETIKALKDEASAKDETIKALKNEANAKDETIKAKDKAIEAMKGHEPSHMEHRRFTSR
jgi:Skp family chaperone for outer membrane proteins